LVSYLQHNGSDDIDVNVVISNSERYMAWMFILHYRLNAVLFTLNVITLMLVIDVSAC
jgi:hypothetical protein